MLYFAGFKEHYSLYPASDRLVRALGSEVARRRVSKGTLRFALSEAVPERLIARVAKFNARRP